MRNRLIGLVMLVASAPVLASAQPAKGAFDEILACRSIGADSARLACFDAAGGKLAVAQQRNDIIVVDREQIRETKRSLFGLSLPSLAILGDKGTPLASLDAILTSAQTGSDGAMTFVLDNGSRWHQQDDAMIGFRPKAGAKVVVRRGALGSYRLSVDNRPAVRVQRIN